MYHIVSILSLGLLIITASASANGRDDNVQGRRPQGKKHNFGIYVAQTTDVRNYPYSAAICTKSTHMFIGNSVILNRNWILTTAYAVDRHSIDDIIVRVGSNDALSGGQKYAFSKVIVHQDYGGQYINDIALLKTTSNIVFTPTVNRVPLSYYTPTTWLSGNLTGYGSSEESYDYLLRDSNFSVIPYGDCVNFYNFLPTKGVFCVDSYVYTASDDDVGAPFVRDNMLLGVVLGGYSWNPTIMYSVLYWKDWIYNQIKYN